MPRSKQTAEPTREHGTVKRVVRDKGFGFITPNAAGAECFFHRSACENFDTLLEGTDVTFVRGVGPKGPRAEFVLLTD